MVEVAKHAVIHASESDFQGNVIESSKPVVVDFWAAWCMPCQMMGPVFEELSKELISIKFVKVNVDDCPNIASNYGIDGIPCIIVFNNGEEIGRLVGYRSKEELRLQIERLLNTKK